MFLYPRVRASGQLRPLHSPSGRRRRGRSSANSGTIYPRYRISPVLFRYVILSRRRRASHRLRNGEQGASHRSVPCRVLFRLRHPFVRASSAIFLSGVIRSGGDARRRQSSHHGNDPLGPRVRPRGRGEVGCRVNCHPSRRNGRYFLQVTKDARSDIRTGARKNRRHPQGRSVRVILYVQSNLFTSPRDRWWVFRPSRTKGCYHGHCSRYRNRDVPRCLFHRLVLPPSRVSKSAHHDPHPCRRSGHLRRRRGERYRHRSYRYRQASSLASGSAISGVVGDVRRYASRYQRHVVRRRPTSPFVLRPPYCFIYRVCSFWSWAGLLFPAKGVCYRGQRALFPYPWGLFLVPVERADSTAIQDSSLRPSKGTAADSYKLLRIVFGYPSFANRKQWPLQVETFPARWRIEGSPSAPVNSMKTSMFDFPITKSGAVPSLPGGSSGTPLVVESSKIPRTVKHPFSYDRERSPV